MSKVWKALAVLVALVVIAALTIDQWLFFALRPRPFSENELPRAPDYAKVTAWAALPETTDDADVALPALPATDQAAAAAAVFYVHPTTWLGDRWNAELDDPETIKAVARGGTLIQASAFNACCAVYAPRYRQAHGRAFIVRDTDAQKAIDVAYNDLDAAFSEFLRRIGEKPFIVAAHSQGSVHAERLVRERIAQTPLRERFIAAYLPGAPVRASIGVPACARATDIGCVASWNARGPKYKRSGFEHQGDNGERFCTSPITWTTDSARAESLGAVFFDAPAPALRPNFTDAHCKNGTLVVASHGDLERDLLSKILLWIIGPQNYHPVEYQLFYADIRKNAVLRVATLLKPRG